jgi:hypothetical protein
VSSEPLPEPNGSEASSRVGESDGSATPPTIVVDAELDVDVIDVDVIVEFDVELDVRFVDCDVCSIVTTDVVEDTSATDVDTADIEVESAVDVVLDAASSTATGASGRATATSVTGARAAETAASMLLASAATPATVAALAACGTMASSTHAAIPMRITTRRRIFIQTRVNYL